MKPRQCAIVGYVPAGMCFNSVSMHHMSDMFHVCYEVTSVNTAKPKSAMCDGDWWNTENSVDCGLVVEQRVVGAVEQSRIEKKEKNKEKTKKKQRKNSDIIAVNQFFCSLYIDTRWGVCPHSTSQSYRCVLCVPCLETDLWTFRSSEHKYSYLLYYLDLKSEWIHFPALIQLTPTLSTAGSASWSQSSQALGCTCSHT